MRKSQLIFALITAFCTTSFYDEQVKADPIVAPACRDVPSCIVTGTVVIGGVVYYVIQNTVTGHVAITAQSATIDVLVANIQQLTENAAAVDRRIDALTSNVTEVTNRVDSLAEQAA